MTNTLNTDLHAPLRIIDADTHVTEPVALWTSRLSKKWGDRVPHVAYDAGWDRDCWIVGDFEPQAFLGLGDPTLTLDCVRAYNDFQTEFASESRDRLVPISVLPFWNVDACVAEMHRCREMGHTGALWAAKLDRLGYPRINSDHWNPVYAAARDLEAPPGSGRSAHVRN